MSRFAFDLATPADDEQLVDLLSATPMDGKVSIALARRPSYFAGASVDGNTVQIGVARENKSGRIVGMGSRSISTRYVNSEPNAVGYLSGLRLFPEYRGHAGLLARGYRFLHKLHEDGATGFYLTTIAADNDAAVNVLTSERAGLPVYHPYGNYHTLAISTARWRRFNPTFRNGPEVRPARHEDRDAILKFLNRYGLSREFFPAYDACDLFSCDGKFKDLNCDDIMLAVRDDDIVGTLGCWNQRRYKQIVVDGYRGWLRPMRPLYNAWAAIRREPTLPSAGSELPARIAAIPVVRDDDPDVFRKLLVNALHRLAMLAEPLLLVGLHERDPMLAMVRDYASREYVTRLYIVYFRDEVPDIAALTRRVPYLELGAL